MASQAGVRQSARTFELQRRKFAVMAAEHVRALGERIRLRREELGMTQDEVARQMKGTLDGQRISKWERGENRPRDESLEDLARVLQTTALALLAPKPRTNGTPNETPDPFAGQDALADRLDRIEAAVSELRREREQGIAEVQALLRRQDAVLERIEQAITREEESARRDDESARRLDEAVQRARQLLVGETPDPAPAPRRRAKSGSQ
jgi:transcriptional regulator with XRE-family HTH domain